MIITQHQGESDSDFGKRVNQALVGKKAYRFDYSIIDIKRSIVSVAVTYRNRINLKKYLEKVDLKTFVRINK